MSVLACQLCDTILDVLVVERKWGWGGQAEKLHIEVELCVWHHCDVVMWVGGGEEGR